MRSPTSEENGDDEREPTPQEKRALRRQFKNIYGAAVGPKFDYKPLDLAGLSALSKIDVGGAEMSRFSLAGSALESISVTLAASQGSRVLDQFNPVINSDILRPFEGVMPGGSLVGPGGMPDIAKLIADVVGASDYSRAVRQVVAAPQIADSILSWIRVPTDVPSVAGYRTAADALLRSIGLDHESELPNVRPTSDDTAFRAIAQASPETAAAISLAADTARNPILPAHTIRNMLALLVVSLIVVAYVGGTVLFPPWGPVVVALLSSSGVTAPAAHKKISKPSDKDQA